LLALADDFVERIEDEAPPQSLEGQRLGQYRIVSRIGTGGMGDVYLAERADEEYQQRVAIKLVRAGAFSPRVQSRLRLERQILATLQHPNIARLFDGGRTPDGTPYLVMEYIQGEPIDVYCDRGRLAAQERLRLVRKICSAVHYAHQNLIVHRDLKPNNILITPEGEPKLLDFGIAKLLDVRHSAQTLAMTHMDYRVMTPAHASPEQVRGDVVTTASDIYVLGLLLYELLTGRRPFQFIGASLLDMERILLEQEPLAASAMVARTGAQSPESLKDIVTSRSTTPARLRRELQGDVDNIIAMALRKEPERRYSSAEQLGADIERHLTGQPVMASSDSWFYRTGKFISRHALAVAASVAAVVTLTVFAVITFVQAQRIAYERDASNAERTRAEQVSSFLVELFELSDPSHSRGNQVTARELLDIGARRVAVGLTDQPETRATLLATIGRVYNSLGLHANAVPVLEEALAARMRIHGTPHTQVANALGELGRALCERGDFTGCEHRLSAALAMQRELLGPQAVELAPLLMERAKLAQRRGEFDSAERHYQQSLAVFRQHGRERTPDAALVMNELAGLHVFRDQLDSAVTLHRAALEIDRQAFGSDHPTVGVDLINLAIALQMQGRLAQAEPLYAESIQVLRKALGDAHPQTLDALANYGRFLHRKRDFVQAEAVLRSVLERNRKARGDRHPLVGHDLVSLGLLRLDRGALAEAEADFRAALDVYTRSLPPDHPYVASALAGLGRAHLEQKRLDEAEPQLRRALAIAQKSLSPDSPTIASARSSLGRLLAAQSRGEEARPLLEESFPILVRVQGENAAATLEARAALDQLRQ
ncbi:MAG TPA: serine/threonine-protein kinase, partial [Steroidobacter sp.]|nr:serine/threonine-protein kinase [Steroidobacter sp.]